MKKLPIEDLETNWPQLIEVDIAGNRNDWIRLLQDISKQEHYVYRQWINPKGSTIRAFWKLQGSEELALWKTLEMPA